MPWPYEVKYGHENRMEADVLVLGGGVGGTSAAIAAAKEGAKVIPVDKAPIERSGSGGVGHDHWLEATTNPASLLTPEYFVDNGGTVLRGPMRYICAKTAWDTIKEIEEAGLVIRDHEDEFDGADFRDGESKLLFAYDYHHKTNLRLYVGMGANTPFPPMTSPRMPMGTTLSLTQFGVIWLEDNDGSSPRVASHLNKSKKKGTV